MSAGGGEGVRVNWEVPCHMRQGAIYKYFKIVSACCHCRREEWLFSLGVLVMMDDASGDSLTAWMGTRRDAVNVSPMTLDMFRAGLEFSSVMI